MAASATARTSASAPARRTPARRAPARRSTPTRKPASGRTRAPAKRRRTGQTPVGGFVPVAAVGGAVGGIADSGLFVWLTRGRLWIGLLGALLVGIVGLNVIALSFSASSSNAGQAADALKRQNSALRAQIAGRLSNSEIQQVAARARPRDARAGLDPLPDAARPMTPKNAAERLRNGELVAGTSATSAAVPVDTTVTTTRPWRSTTTAPVDDHGPGRRPRRRSIPRRSRRRSAPAAQPPATDTASTAGAVGAP